MTTMQARLAELREELSAGERALAELDQRREQLVTNMLRISGAVQVLEELAAVDEQTEPLDELLREPAGASRA